MARKPGTFGSPSHTLGFILILSLIWGLVAIFHANHQFSECNTVPLHGIIQGKNVTRSVGSTDRSIAMASSHRVNPLLDFLPNEPPHDQIIGRTKKRECFMETNHTNQWATARIIIFQRDTGMKLINLLSYYLQVLDPNSIVIIDHLGKDPFTESILKHYDKMGVHIWKCTGPWKRKAEMWSGVTRRYGNYSRFVFPLDSDEYLVTVQKQSGQPLLEWSQDSLHKALSILGHKELPFKLFQYDLLPLDCGSSTASFHKADPRCNIQVIEALTGARKQCFRKTFARGNEFLKTDQGNHIGGSNKSPNKSEVWQGCLERNVMEEFWEIAINLAVIHTSSMNFYDWLIHALRGAADYNYNEPNLECKSWQKGRLYCEEWQELYKVGFDVWKMKDLYQRKMCGGDSARTPLDFTLPSCRV